MGGLVKPALTCEPNVAAVGEVNALDQTTHHGRQIVFGARAQRAGAERHTVRRAVHEPYEALEGSRIGDDPWQPEDGPRRIIRMEREAHAGLFRGRPAALQEIAEVVPELLSVHVPVGSQQCLQLGGTVSRGPSWQLSGPARQVD